MFPIVNISAFEIESFINYTNNPDIQKSFYFDFLQRKFEIISGNLKLIKDIEAVKQWITLFLLTDINKVPVYQDQKFGTSIKKIIGYKSIDNGFVESEIQREIEEGFLLNPAIEKVTYFDINKSGLTKSYAVITLNVLLKNGAIIENLQVAI